MSIGQHASTTPATITAEVTSCKLLNANTSRISLKPLTENPFSFSAGQYLNILLPGGEACPYSIANAPADTSELELHIMEQISDSRSVEVMTLLRKEGIITIELPLGDCFLPPGLPKAGDAPLLLLAASTGFSQIYSILLDAFANGFSIPIHLYWGVKKAADFYLLDELTQLRSQHKNFEFHLVVSEAGDGCNWVGREGMLNHAVIEDFTTLKNAHAVISGSPTMVYATFDVLVDLGLRQMNTYSDVFSYAPRM